MYSTKPEQDHLTLWKRGVYLSAALFHFSTQEWRDKYQALSKGQNNLLTDTLESQADDTRGLSDSDHALAALKTLAPVVRSFTDLHLHVKIMRDAIIREVLSGNLIALGYSLPRHPADKPVLLPDDIWAGKIKWEQSEIKGKGLHFVSVRLAWDSIEEEKHADILSLPAPKAAGRPSLKEDIVNAFRYLDSLNRIDFAKPMAAFYEPLKNYLIETYPDKAGQYRTMSNETIRIHTADLYRQSKKQKT